MTNIRGENNNNNFRTTQINLYTTAGEIAGVNGLVFEITDGSNTARANFGEGGNGGHGHEDGVAEGDSDDTVLASSGGGGAETGDNNNIRFVNSVQLRSFLKWMVRKLYEFTSSC